MAKRPKWRTISIFVNIDSLHWAITARWSLVVEILAGLGFDPHLTSLGVVSPHATDRPDRFAGARTEPEVEPRVEHRALLEP